MYRNPSLYVIAMICIFPERVLNKILLCVINVGNKVITLAYLTPDQHECYSDTGENSSKRGIANILATMPGTAVEMLPAILTGSKIIFLGDHIPLWKVVLQDAKCSEDTQEDLKYLLHTFKDIMSSS